MCKIMDIDRVLIQSGILDQKGNNFNCYLCIFMIRRMQIATGSQINKTKYMIERLQSDCEILGELLGIPIDKRITVSELQESWHLYCENKDNQTAYDKALAFFVESIGNSFSKESDSFRLVDIVNQLVSRYEINEIFVDENNKQKLVSGIFSIIEYSTMPLQQKVASPSGFKQICREHWQKINKNKYDAILRKYAYMIYDYDHRLNEFIRFEEGSLNSDGNSIAIKKYVKPADDTIKNTETWFENIKESKGNGESPNEIIDLFKNNLTPIEDLMDNWQETFSKLSKYADNLQAQLNKHAAALREKYVEELNKRSREMQRLQLEGPYRVDKQTKKEIEELIEERNKVLEDMRKIQITPILHYKEQTKIETKLLIANDEVTHYIECLKATKDMRIAVLLVSVLLSLTVLFYAILQHNVFLPLTIVYPASYLFLTLIGMAILSVAPVLHYKSMIRKSLKKLKGEINDVAKKYELKAKNIQQNLNQCNALDDITRHIHWREYNTLAYNNRKNAKKWYIDRAIEHRARLSAFSDLYQSDFEAQPFNSFNYPNITDDGEVDDVVDCMLFWPNA